MEGLALVEAPEPIKQDPTQNSVEDQVEQAQAPNDPAPVETLEVAKPQAKSTQKAYDSLDSVLKALNDQDEQLKTMRSQISEMLSTNAALKRGIKQIVADATQNEELENELNLARKKLSMLKTFING